jgi:uncharacterized ion transporter superfamily protein YfcC
VCISILQMYSSLMIFRLLFLIIVVVVVIVVVEWHSSWVWNQTKMKWDKFFVSIKQQQQQQQQQQQHMNTNNELFTQNETLLFGIFLFQLFGFCSFQTKNWTTHKFVENKIKIKTFERMNYFLIISTWKCVLIWWMNNTSHIELLSNDESWL